MNKCIRCDHDKSQHYRSSAEMTFGILICKGCSCAGFRPAPKPEDRGEKKEGSFALSNDINEGPKIAPQKEKDWEEKFNKLADEVYEYIHQTGHSKIKNFIHSIESAAEERACKKEHGLTLTRGNGEYIKERLALGRTALLQELEEWINDNTEISPVIHKTAILTLLKSKNPQKNEEKS